MHTLHKRTYPIYTNAYTYTPPQTYIYTHTYKVTHRITFKHIQTYAHSQANKQLCPITNTDIPTHTHACWPKNINVRFLTRTC